MSDLVRHEPCPKCRSFGADRSGNNLARYSDGSAWCFAGHGLVEGANRIPIQQEKDDGRQQHVAVDNDLHYHYPQHVVDWLNKYGITVQEAIGHGWMYGPVRDQLVFIFKDLYGNVSCTQARNFSPNAKRKYFNQGDANSTLPIFSRATERTKSIVVVEDAVSAAKVGRQVDATPCLGSYLRKAKLAELKRLGYENLVAWLDEDKLREAMKIADQAKWLGFTTQVVHTPLDPKEYDDKEITKYLRARV